MKYKRAFKVILAIGVSLVSASAMTWADGSVEAEPLALHKIMQNQSMQMQTITDGISREDWQLVAIIALLIAEHPQPPLTEKMRILRFVGTDAGKYKKYDNKTYQSAQELRRAAQRQEGSVVISVFATLQNSCLACHQNFRKPFQEHFYEYS